MKSDQNKEMNEGIVEKKEWTVPTLHIIPFKNTKGGGANNTAEDSYTNPQGS